MSKAWVVFFAVLFVMPMGAPWVMAGTLVEFDGGIGVIPVVTAGANVVRGVSPAGNPWVIRKFEAKVKENGEIRAEGKGLVLAGSNSIGTPDGVTTVAVSLFCGSDVFHNSGAHPLAADGDFKFRDTLSPVPPDPCTNPVLLIRANGSGGPWLAAGIPDLED